MEEEDDLYNDVFSFTWILFKLRAVLFMVVTIPLLNNPPLKSNHTSKISTDVWEAYGMPKADRNKCCFLNRINNGDFCNTVVHLPAVGENVCNDLDKFCVNGLEGMLKSLEFYCRLLPMLCIFIQGFI